MPAPSSPLPAAGKPVVVFKVGGSLLNHSGLADCLRELCRQRPDSVPLLTVGGGGTADLVRQWQPLHGLSDEQAHWLAIDAVGLNEVLLQKLLPDLRVVRSGSQLAAAGREGAWPLLCAPCFLRWVEAQGFEPLPRSWDVTSDSIAAWIARVIGAEELVLLKSRPLETGISAAAASAAGLVDAHFVSEAPLVRRISWVNARAEPLRIAPWLSSGQPV